MLVYSLSNSANIIIALAGYNAQTSKSNATFNRCAYSQHSRFYNVSTRQAIFCRAQHCHNIGTVLLFRRKYGYAILKMLKSI